MIDFLIKFSPVVTAACFMASILVALWQIRINRLIQQRSKAQDLWSMYLSKGIEFPLLAYPLRHVKFNFPTKSLSTGRKDEDEQQEFERYEWLLSFLLKTAREILQEFSEDEFWIKTIKRNVRYHREYLAWRRGLNIADDFISLSGPKVNELVDLVIREHV